MDVLSINANEEVTKHAQYMKTFVLENRIAIAATIIFVVIFTVAYFMSAGHLYR